MLNLSFKPQKINERGKPVWRIHVDYNEKKSPVYLRFATEQLAKEKQRELEAKKAADNQLAIDAEKTANAHSIASCQAKLAIVGSTIEEATRYFLENNFAKVGRCSVKEAMKAFLADAIKGEIKSTTLDAYTRKTKKISIHP